MKFLSKTIGIILIGVFLFTGLSYAGVNLRYSPLEWHGKEKYFDFGGYTAIGINIATAALNTTGNIRYVDSGNSNAVNNSGAGKSQNAPFATLDYAISQMTANNGDVIILMPGHAETIAAADGFDVDVAGITILGMGRGTDMPEFTFTATASTVAIGAANVTIANVRFLAGVSAIVIGIAVEAGGDNFTLIDCEFPEPTTSTFEFIDAIDLASGADSVHIINNIYFNADATGADHFIDAGNGVNNDLQIIGNYIYGEFAVSAIWSDTIDLEVLIADNNITNLTNGEHAIEFTTTALGSIRDNLVRTDAQATAIDPGSMTMSNNLWDADASVDTVAAPAVLGTAGEASIGTVNATTTDQIHGKIGTDTEMADSSLSDVLWAGAGIVAFPAAAKSANGVSIAEVLRAVEQAENPTYLHPNYIALSVDLTSATWNTAAAHEILTVTGNIRLRVMVECTETLTDGADAATLSLGDEITVAGMIASTSAGGAGAANQLDAGEFWIDATPADVSPVATSSVILDFVVLQGADVGYTIGGEALTDGTLIFHMWWYPLDSTGAAVVGAGGAL